MLDAFIADMTHAHDAGMTPKAYDRAAGQARYGAMIANKMIANAQRPPVANAVIQELPKDFVRESLAKLEVHIRAGHWEQAKRTIDAIDDSWKLRKKIGTNDGLALGLHVSWLFDSRATNLIEDVCAGTVGALLECFPDAFIGHPGCGPGTIRKIAERLLARGLLSEIEAQWRIDKYERAMRQNACDK